MWLYLRVGAGKQDAEGEHSQHGAPTHPMDAESRLAETNQTQQRSHRKQALESAVLQTTMKKMRKAKKRRRKYR
jgi:hypothetical protein